MKSISGCIPVYNVLGHSEGQIIRLELSISISSGGIFTSNSEELDLHFLSVKQAKDKRELRSALSCLASVRLSAQVRQSST